MRCIHCQTSLLPNARFCHACGEKVKGKPTTCPSCQTENLPGAKFCTICSCALTVVSETTHGIDNYAPIYNIDFGVPASNIANQIEGFFLQDLANRIHAEYDSKLHKTYETAASVSGLVNKSIPLLSQQWAEKVYTIHCRQDETVLAAIDSFLASVFDIQMDVFFFEEAKHLSEYTLSAEKIQKYAYATRNDIDLEQMIFDYLNLEQKTGDKIYVDLLQLPEQKIRTAAKSFLFAERKEKIYLIGDQTVFGSCKEGFAITERGIYWKAHFNRATAVRFENLQKVKKESGWITINDRYFHVSKVFDFRLMKLLQKIQKIF